MTKQKDETMRKKHCLQTTQLDLHKLFITSCGTIGLRSSDSAGIAFDPFLDGLCYAFSLRTIVRISFPYIIFDIIWLYLSVSLCISPYLSDQDCFHLPLKFWGPGTHWRTGCSAFGWAIHGRRCTAGIALHCRVEWGKGQQPTGLIDISPLHRVCIAFCIAVCMYYFKLI